ncbi:MAG: hypothetical protein JSU96_18765 [Acidobacteriota bacterium]|nr:MAG: hypothetical protein JSU96_18765 [Acidobacteriota bacterium]
MTEREDLEKCPNCQYVFLEKVSRCPYCGEWITYPGWMKAGAWILLILIVYGLIKCHVRMLDGFEGI